MPLRNQPEEVLHVGRPSDHLLSSQVGLWLLPSPQRCECNMRSQLWRHPLHIGYKGSRTTLPPSEPEFKTRDRIRVVRKHPPVLLPRLLPFWTLLPLTPQDVSNPLEISVKKPSIETGTNNKGKRVLVSVLSVCADLFLVSA